MIRRLARRLRHTAIGDRRLVLVADVDNIQTAMSMILHAARTMGAPDTVDPATAISIWSSWSVKVKAWAEESGS